MKEVAPRPERTDLLDRVDRAYELLRECRVCPRACGAKRLQGEVGPCGVGRDAGVYLYGPNFGKEAPLIGWRGSGTLFMTGCNLHCVFCKNFRVSQLCQGDLVTVEHLAAMMLGLQELGCHNICFVTPTHVAPQILHAVSIAARKGLTVPLVYDCGGYESVEMLSLLDGIIDVYVPDIKFADAAVAREFVGVEDYPKVARTAVREMHRQVGDLTLDEQGLAQRGLLVRHLLLPHGLAGTGEVLRFITRDIARDTYVHIMPEYQLAYRASQHPLLGRPVTEQEYAWVLQVARREGLWRLDKGMRERLVRRARLQADYEGMLALKEGSDLIDFEVVGPLPPERYLVKFYCRGISRINGQGEPIFATEHRVEILLSDEYPRCGPQIWFLTPIWHPQVGHPTEIVDYGQWFPPRRLSDLVLRLYDMVRYQDFYDEESCAMNREAAAWCREYRSRHPGCFPIDPRSPIIGPPWDGDVFIRLLDEDDVVVRILDEETSLVEGRVSAEQGSGETGG